MSLGAFCRNAMDETLGAEQDHGVEPVLVQDLGEPGTPGFGSAGEIQNLFPRRKQAVAGIEAHAPGFKSAGVQIVLSALEKASDRTLQKNDARAIFIGKFPTLTADERQAQPVLSHAF